MPPAPETFASAAAYRWQDACAPAKSLRTVALSSCQDPQLRQTGDTSRQNCGILFAEEMVRKNLRSYTRASAQCVWIWLTSRRTGFSLSGFDFCRVTNKRQAEACPTKSALRAAIPYDARIFFPT